ncbi:hypothetical protein SDRG_02195 [Saprolegnia diclina VS20]|uniref:Retrotransposon Copia-like N-terminal domain-containing protein n=1 Tax=Saprolegnia diclina (strain VS20) TaxID=1156394 RepID=T0S572_SAPDV|nr:hypothetical protein SDRG_02195 [Saprolegnia diclina VS20]EQC40293.1 hypothetical protein SDRG_02195 [Saprolegnia diclina VS20]|eukprot:XP_008605992.1 hypothetical protein SDRG_02195 [Saprolegnia diclina VS20]
MSRQVEPCCYLKLQAGGSNYREWADAITTRMTKAGLAKYLGPHPPNYKADDDLAAGVYLRLSLHRHDLMHLKDAKTTHATWEILRRLYEPKTGSSLLLLYTQMDNLRWIESRGSLTDFADAFLGLQRHMAAAGDTTPASAFLIRFLTLLPARFNATILRILHDSTKGPVFPSFETVLAELQAVDALHTAKTTTTKKTTATSPRHTTASSPTRPARTSACSYCGNDQHALSDCYRRQRDLDRGLRRRTTLPDDVTPTSPTVRARATHPRGRSLPCDVLRPMVFGTGRVSPQCSK